MSLLDSCAASVFIVLPPRQGSTDHRGTPQRPGRTVTLTSDNDPEAITWGVAFQLAGTPEEQAATLSYLEWREKQYDVRELVDVYNLDGTMAVRGALVYIASPSNPNYLGPADMLEIATQIAMCGGPSGPNCDYLFKLADAMRAMGVPDEDLYGLEALVRQELSRRVVDPHPTSGGTQLLRGGPASSGGTMAACTSTGGGAVQMWHEHEQEHQFRRWHEKGQAGPQLGAALGPDGTHGQDQGQLQRTVAVGARLGRSAEEEVFTVEEDQLAAERARLSGADGAFDCPVKAAHCGGKNNEEHPRAVYSVDAVCGHG